MLSTITVDTLADVNANDGLTTLREAIAAAMPNDTIDFSVTGTIQLTNVGHVGEIVINNNVTINGPGANVLAVTAFDPTPAQKNGDGSRVFYISAPDIADVSISGLTLTGGDVTGNGAAIVNIENLTITDCRITENAATGAPPANGGAIMHLLNNLVINRSTISGNTANVGGGLFVLLGNLTVTESTISGNTAAFGSGGGIYASSANLMTVANSTISGNTASLWGGGIYAIDSTVNVTSSTISGNSATSYFGYGGGIYSQGNTLTVSHSTITGNSTGVGGGGGIRRFGGAAAVLEHTIVAGNLRLGATPDDIFAIVDATSAYNLVGVDTGLTGTSNGTNGNQIGTAGSPLNPLLGSLADNGGPTETHALLPGSPAIDAGDPAFAPPPDFDQRGTPFDRDVDIQGGGDRIDIGAFEVQGAPASLVVDTTLDELDLDFGPGDLSLREAIGWAHTLPGAETITFDASLGGEPIVLDQGLGELAIRDSMTIAGLGADQLTIYGGGSPRIFHVDDGNSGTFKDVSISGLALSGGNAYLGGAIYSFENLTVSDCTISGNTASLWGGGIYSAFGNLTVIGSTISGNRTTSAFSNGGGGISSQGNTLTVSHSTITGNFTAGGDGGGIRLSGVAAVLEHTIVAGNLLLGSTPDDIFGAVDASSSFNLVGVNTGLTGITNGMNGNLVGTAGSPIDALLGPLADNGGPTETHALLPGSPAIDAGDPAFAPPPDYDQRGAPFDRDVDIQGGGERIDMGAFEVQGAPASLVVDTTVDELDLDFGTGDLSLREAIGWAHTFPGAETITFAASLTSGGPATILLTQGELAIRDAVTISGPGANLLTIKAFDPMPDVIDGDGSRVFNIDNGASALVDVEIVGLTLTGGDASSPGGGIFNRENLTVADSVITGNQAIRGGGLYHTSGDLSVLRSIVSGNTSGPLGSGSGGGIYNFNANLSVIDSTISGNSVGPLGGGGAGIYSRLTVASKTSAIIGTTISGNFGDGVQNRAGLTVIRHSTITGNSLGVVAQAPMIDTRTEVYSSIVAGNVGDDLLATGMNNSIESFGYNLIGTGSTSLFTQSGDQTGVADPLLGPLADNGGPTMTHALLPGSPAIDAGDANFDPADPDGDPMTDDAVPFDQRGNPFVRVFDGDGMNGARIDIGAFESIPDDAVHALFGDYNRNGVVDAADYTTWRDTLGQSVLTPYSGADGDGDGTIDQDDYDVWKSHFGQTLPIGSGAIAWPGPVALEEEVTSGQQSPMPTAPLARLVARTEAAVRPVAVDRALAELWFGPVSRVMAERRLEPWQPLRPRMFRPFATDSLLLVARQRAGAVSHGHDATATLPSEDAPSASDAAESQPGSPVGQGDSETKPTWAAVPQFHYRRSWGR